MSFFRRKKKEKEGTSGSAAKPKKEMPLFKSQSDRGRKRQQDQEMLAQQDPEPKFDLSDCEMFEMPEGVFAMCKVLQKEVLLLNDNVLKDLNKGGDLADLERLMVLDLHNNHFKVLPDEIHCLKLLQVLDLSNNKLSQLPQSFTQLKCLRTLKLKENRFKTFPSQVCELPQLRTLDISHNEIKSLPIHLSKNRALETLVLDAHRMDYPSKDVCEKTTADIMMCLCKDAGIEYEHPSKYWSKAGDDSLDNGHMYNITALEMEMNNGVKAYQSVLDKKRQEVEELERTIQAENLAQAEMAAKAAEEQRRLLSSLTQNDEQETQDLSQLNKQREEEKEEFLKYLNDLENGASSLLAQLLDYNTKAKETEELIEEMEKARMKEDDSFKVRWEEFQNVRKQEVLDNMKIMLADFAAMEEARLVVQSENDQRVFDAMEEENLNIGQIESLIDYKNMEHRKMVTSLAKEDELQRAAFEALLLSQDAAHQRIHQQIGLLEAELAQLTAAEMAQRARRTEVESSIVADHRIALSAMLAQLLDERDKRRIELRKRLSEMEQEREDGQIDYWLVQYQRLLDWKPQSLIDKESNLEIAVKEILVSSGAEDYIPVFARHRITIETMMILTEADLSQMGIHELGLRKAIMKNIDIQRSEGSFSEKAKAKEKELELELPFRQPSSASQSVPSAPPVGAQSAAAKFETQLSVTARGLYSECAICLDKESNIIFLPCGHVCCCGECAQPISECPLCRAQINTKVKLSLPLSPGRSQTEVS